MKFRQVLSIVPKSVKTGAAAIVVCAAIVAPIIGFMKEKADGIPSMVIGSMEGLGVGLLIGVGIAVWVSALGYVYADARRRGMPPILCTLIAALIPNLLGFLVYFALRRPIPLPCAQCGHAVAAGQRFCSSCGHPQPSPASSATASPSESGLNTGATA